MAVDKEILALSPVKALNIRTLDGSGNLQNERRRVFDVGAIHYHPDETPTKSDSPKLFYTNNKHYLNDKLLGILHSPQGSGATYYFDNPVRFVDGVYVGADRGSTGDVGIRETSTNQGLWGSASWLTAGTGDIFLISREKSTGDVLVGLDSMTNSLRLYGPSIYIGKSNATSDIFVRGNLKLLNGSGSTTVTIENGGTISTPAPVVAQYFQVRGTNRSGLGTDTSSFYKIKCTNLDCDTLTVGGKPFSEVVGTNSDLVLHKDYKIGAIINHPSTNGTGENPIKHTSSESEGIAGLGYDVYFSKQNFISLDANTFAPSKDLKNGQLHIDGYELVGVTYNISNKKLRKNHAGQNCSHCYLFKLTGSGIQVSMRNSDKAVVEIHLIYHFVKSGVKSLS